MNEFRELSMAGIDYRISSASVRQALSLSPSQISALLRRTAATVAGLEAVVLSTCHRTEFYVAASPGTRAIDTLLQFARQERSSASIRRFEGRSYVCSGATALQHLLRVACGLDSMTLGDPQILSQIKQAVDLAGISGTLGKTLSQVFLQAIRCGRKARAETVISKGCASIGSAIVETISRHLTQTDSPEIPRLLLIGTGDTAADIAWHLSKRHLGCWTILNRSREDAYRLAANCGGKAARWEELDRLVTSSSVVVAAASVTEPVVRREHLETIAAARPSRFPLLIDAGAPPNIESGGPYPVIDIDLIRQQRDAVLDARQAALPEVERMIADELTCWKHWLAARPIESSLADLYRAIEIHSHEIAQRLFRNGRGFSPQDAERILQASLRQLLTSHARRMGKLQRDAFRSDEQACIAD